MHLKKGEEIFQASIIRYINHVLLLPNQISSRWWFNVETGDPKAHCYRVFHPSVGGSSRWFLGLLVSGSPSGPSSQIRKSCDKESSQIIFPPPGGFGERWWWWGWSWRSQGRDIFYSYMIIITLITHSCKWTSLAGKSTLFSGGILANCLTFPLLLVVYQRLHCYTMGISHWYLFGVAQKLGSHWVPAITLNQKSRMKGEISGSYTPNILIIYQIGQIAFDQMVYMV